MQWLICIDWARILLGPYGEYSPFVRLFIFWKDYHYIYVTEEDPCVTKAKAGDCEFYSCFEEKHSCPKKINYATEYGLNFCKRYDKHLSEFTSDVRYFLSKLEW